MLLLLLLCLFNTESNIIHFSVSCRFAAESFWWRLMWWKEIAAQWDLLLWMLPVDALKRGKGKRKAFKQAWSSPRTGMMFDSRGDRTAWSVRSFLFLFVSFYDSGWFQRNESLLNVLTLIFDWYPFLYLLLVTALSSMCYGFFPARLIFTPFLFIRLFLLLSLLGDLFSTWWPHTHFYFLSSLLFQ